MGDVFKYVGLQIIQINYCLKGIIIYYKNKRRP
jgi:hypothetical protein